MAKLIFAMNVSLDGYVDHEAMAPSPVLFRHWIRSAAAVLALFALASCARQANDPKAQAVGAGQHTWLLTERDVSGFPSLSYANPHARQIRFNLWCRWRGAVIIGRLTRAHGNGSALRLSSGEHQLTTSLDLLREPHNGFPVGGVLAENDPVLRTFGKTGQLTLRLGNETLVMNAVDERERQTVRRFFELCYDERQNEPSLPWHRS